MGRATVLLGALSVGLAALLACSDADTSETWQVVQPTGWTELRFTLTQAQCPNSSGNGPCTFPVNGSGTSTPLMCKIPGMTALSQGGVGYTCGMVFPVAGNIVGDSIALNFGVYSDGAKVDFSGHVSGDRSIIGDLIFTDPTSVQHHIGPTCTRPGSGPLCLDTDGQLQFTHGGMPVALISR